MIKSAAILLLIQFALLSSVKSQQLEHSIRHLSVSDGLSQSSVIDIAQDKNGFIWFGTRDGLNKYDGHKFTVYNRKDNDTTSISNNDILELLVDSEGDLWVGTFNGLNKYDYAKDQFMHFFNNREDSNTISDNIIWSICESSNGDIWIGTSEGLNRYNKKTRRFSRFYHDSGNNSSLSNNVVLDIFEDKDGFLWIGTANGLNKLTISSKGHPSFIRYLDGGGKEGGVSGNFIQAITEDKSGNLWIGTKNDGLNKFEKEAGAFKSFKHNPGDLKSLSHNDIRSISFDTEGKLWIGTYKGLNSMDVENEVFTRILNDRNNPQSLSKNSIKSLFIDKSETVWVGTYYGGINMLNAHFNNFQNYNYRSDDLGLQFDVISAIVEDDAGNVYIGTEGGGVNVLNVETGEFNYIVKEENENSLSNNNIKSLYLDQNDHLWIGTFNGGLNILDLKTRQFSVYQEDPNDPHAINDNNIYAIQPKNDSLYWIGTYGGGLNLFNKNTRKFTNLTKDEKSRLTSNNIRSLFKDSGGNLWIGTQYGLNFLSAENHTKFDIIFKSYFFHSESMAGEDILTIFEDSESRIWVGTNESGLSYYDVRKDKFVKYDLSSVSGATSNVVHGILEDADHNLWISTNNGILKLNPENNTSDIFDESNGLISNEYNNNSCLKTKNGQMYFGSLEGLTTFHPDSIKINEYVPSVVLTDFKLFGETVKVGGKDGVLGKIVSKTEAVSLDHDQAIFSIEFAIPNFVNPANNRYAYRLKGLEEKWNYTNNNLATYTIQKSGTYIFEVKGANNDDLWNTTPTQLRVKVNPAPWRTWWAFGLYALIIGIALALLINIIYSRSKLRHALELEHLNHEKQESLNQMKLQFFTNISHEFRTPLTLILGPLEQITGNLKASNVIYKQLKLIENNANRLLRLIDQLMDFRKFENNHLQLRAAEYNIVSFVEEIYISFKQYADLHKFNYEFVSEIDQQMVWFDRDKMERVIFNLISNAFKYTPDGGAIKVIVRELPHNVEVSVVDDGIGMASQHLEKIFERFYEIDRHDKLSKTKYNKGTGIGLALAKGIVDLHSGNIKVKSKENEGSTFTIMLPLGNQHLKEIQKSGNLSDKGQMNNDIDNLLPACTSEEISDPEYSKNTPIVLIVEDNTEVRKYMVQLFKNAYKVIIASNGKEGLEEALLHVPDLVISDVMMPEMDGIEFCFQLKSNIKTSHIPFILLTARTSVSYKHEGLEMGADDYINKPFNVKELKIKAKNLITSRQKLKEKFSNGSIITPGEITVTSVDEKLLDKALKIAEDNISNENFDVAVFCEELGVSRTMLFTKIRAWTNLTPNEFMMVMRMKRAAQLLEQNKLNVSQIGFQVGFKNPKYFSKCFQKHFSETPSNYAKKFTSSSEVEI